MLFFSDTYGLKSKPNYRTGAMLMFSLLIAFFVNIYCLNTLGHIFQNARLHITFKKNLHNVCPFFALINSTVPIDM